MVVRISTVENQEYIGLLNTCMSCARYRESIGWDEEKLRHNYQARTTLRSFQKTKDYTLKLHYRMIKLGFR